MIRLHILGEGHTEKRFVEDLFCNHLIEHNIIVDVCCFLTKFVVNAGQQHKGGISKYDKVRNDINNRIKEDNNADSRFTTMIDFYGLPTDFPKYREASRIDDPYRKVEMLESAFAQDIGDNRFIPYIQLHEFEALIFADPAKLIDEYIGYEKQIEDLQLLSTQIKPEMINENPQTSPSHRIIDAIPAYDKLYAGSKTTKAIGLPTIRMKCPHFNEWLSRLESLCR